MQKYDFYVSYICKTLESYFQKENYAVQSLIVIYYIFISCYFLGLPSEGRSFMSV